LGSLDVGWKKVACWSTKAAIHVYLKREKIEEKLLRRAYRNSSTLFRTVSSLTPYGLLFPKIGGLPPPPKTPIAIISGTGKATDFKLAGKFTGPSEQKLIKNFGEKGGWAYPFQGLPIFLDALNYLKNGYSSELQILYAHL